MLPAMDLSAESAFFFFFVGDATQEINSSIRAHRELDHDFSRPDTTHRLSWYNGLQGGLRLGGLTPACGSAHAHIGHEMYKLRPHKSDCTAKGCTQVFSFEIKKDGQQYISTAVCTQNTSGGRSTMTYSCPFGLFNYDSYVSFRAIGLIRGILRVDC